MDQGFKQAGYHTALAYDSEQHCVDTVNRNHGRIAVRGDLSVLTPEDVREAWDGRESGAPVGIIGGPPCQAFSFANVHKDDGDDRAKLVARYAEIIDSLNRHYGISFFVFENVTGLLSPSHRHLLDHFIGRAEDAGFSVEEQCLNAVNYRVPQHRERVFVVGTNRRLHPGVDFVFPSGDPSRRPHVRSVLEGLDEPAHFNRRLTPDDIPVHPNHWCMTPRSSRFTDGSITPGDSTTSRSFRAVHWDRPSFTVAYGNREVHVHPECHRRLSVYEAMLLQGFDDGYVLEGNMSQQFNMISDAVAPPVAEAIARALTEQLGLG